MTCRSIPFKSLFAFILCFLLGQAILAKPFDTDSDNEPEKVKENNPLSFKIITEKSKKKHTSSTLQTEEEFQNYVSRKLSVMVENTFLGDGAGVNNTGDRNTFVGSEAGNQNTTGTNNAFFGSKTGRDNTTGQDNSFFGSLSGQNNTTGLDNSFFGKSAGNTNTTGNFNSFVGKDAGLNNLMGSNNSFFGSRAGEANTTGNQNSFFGQASGLVNTMGSNNSFFGLSAGSSNTTGLDNSFFGGNAGDTNTIGTNNSIFGEGADVGSNNLTFATAIGSDAVITASSTIQLGRNGTDVVRIGTTGTSGTTNLCLNGNSEISTCTNTVVTTTGTQTLTNKTLTSPVINGSPSITGLSNPTNASDAANKAYVDAQAGGGGGGSLPLIGRKTAEQTVTTTTGANVVSVSLAAGKTYYIEVNLGGRASASSASNQSLVYSGTATVDGGMWLSDAQYLPGTAVNSTPGFTRLFFWGTGLSFNTYAVRGYLTTTSAGTLSVHIAKDAGGDPDLIVRAGSHIVATEVSP